MQPDSERKRQAARRLRVAAILRRPIRRLRAATEPRAESGFLLCMGLFSRFFIPRISVMEPSGR
jgi:hypothetical protein